MGIYRTLPPLAPGIPEIPDIDIAQMAGRFGGFPVGEMETIDDMDTAPVGTYVVRKGGESGYMKATKNIPPAAQPYGTVLTISSVGAGEDGRRRITIPLPDDEFVYQLYFDTSLALFTRSGFGAGGFTPWKKQTPKR
ncbi:hypothetical protein CJ745_21495 [Salmonella enterica subsp. enterica]|nr:hypothetical protein [Salmonella enterica]EAW1477804.1 hypothetical protein [Salmonella enterica subsp. enterica]EED9463125.1 hypothetical protein [Salmonella enterica subsp. enterica serovar Abaetetuba]EBP8535587.1 hypothetical protein [Salmonella enterica]EBR1114057.1 hypothetical protein [Salmonella enterica]